MDLSDGLTWGIGAGFPSRAKLRVTTELHGEQRFSNTLTAAGPLVSLSGDGSLSPLVSDVANLTKATVGLTYQARNGFFVGYGVNYSWPTANVSTIPNSDANKNFWGQQVRIGYHPGVRIYVPPPPPAAAAAAPAAAAAAAPAPGAHADGAGGVQSLHGAGEPAVDGDGDADGFDRLCRDLSLDARRRGRSPTRRSGRRRGPRPARPARCR